MIDFFIYYVLSKQKLKKYNKNNSKMTIMTGVNLTPQVQNAHFFAGRQKVKNSTIKRVCFWDLKFFSLCRTNIISTAMA